MKKLNYNIIFVLILLFGSQLLKGQTDVLFSNSGMNAEVFNPALIENNNMINLQMLTRRQWVGFPDAPTVEQLSLSTFFDNRSMGLKFSVINQTVGKEITRKLNLAYAYRIYLNPEISLNMGLSAGMYQRQIEFSKLVFLDGNEPMIRPDERYLRPDFDFGLHFIAYDFVFGYAANHLTTLGRDASISRIPIHQHLYTFYLFRLSYEAQLRAGLSFHQQGKINYLQADLQLYVNKLQAGIGWRNKDAFLIKAGLRTSDLIEIVYSYDIGINRFANFNSGTHEFAVILRLARKSNAFLSPRFMDY
ncbi:MAG: PorP/SprF family type IX secretion system membrane protein [Bacteroidales bacterium]|nr:PorP/SprF family type IX secretion system membrane protein [Bacteroidales bacterium]